MDFSCKHNGKEQNCIQLVPIFCGLNNEERKVEHHQQELSKGEMIIWPEKGISFYYSLGKVKISRISKQAGNRRSGYWAPEILWESYPCLLTGF